MVNVQMLPVNCNRVVATTYIFQVENCLASDARWVTVRVRYYNVDKPFPAMSSFNEQEEWSCSQDKRFLVAFLLCTITMPYMHVQNCAVLYKIRNVRPQVQSSQLLEKGLLYGRKVC